MEEFFESFTVTAARMILVIIVDVVHSNKNERTQKKSINYGYSIFFSLYGIM